MLGLRSATGSVDLVDRAEAPAARRQAGRSNAAECSTVGEAVEGTGLG